MSGNERNCLERLAGTSPSLEKIQTSHIVLRVWKRAQLLGEACRHQRPVWRRIQASHSSTCLETSACYLEKLAGTSPSLVWRRSDIAQLVLACLETSAIAYLEKLAGTSPSPEKIRHRTSSCVSGNERNCLEKLAGTSPSPEKIRHRISLYMSRNERNCLDLLGCFSLRRALASICRIRSRVTANFLPTSSNV